MYKHHVRSQYIQHHVLSCFFLRNSISLCRFPKGPCVIWGYSNSLWVEKSLKGCEKQIMQYMKYQPMANWWVLPYSRSILSLNLVFQSYCWWFRNPEQPPGMALTPWKWWDKLPTSTGERWISEPSTIPCKNWCEFTPPFHTFTEAQAPSVGSNRYFITRCSWWRMLDSLYCITIDGLGLRHLTGNVSRCLQDDSS